MIKIEKWRLQSVNLEILDFTKLADIKQTRNLFLVCPQPGRYHLERSNLLKCFFFIIVKKNEVLDVTPGSESSYPSNLFSYGFFAISSFTYLVNTVFPLRILSPSRTTRLNYNEKILHSQKEDNNGWQKCLKKLWININGELSRSFHYHVKDITELKSHV